jgi:hypothetical protein
MRQLHLFKGGRQKPPAPKELELHVHLVAFIRRWITSGWLFTHFASGERRDLLTAVRLKRMGVSRGFPDLVFFGPHRTTVFLELKRADGSTLTDDQTDVRDRLQANGFAYVTTDNLKDALGVLKHYGIVRAEVSA